MDNNKELISEKREKVLELYEEIDLLEDLLNDETNQSKITNLKVKIEILTTKQIDLLEEIKNLTQSK